MSRTRQPGASGGLLCRKSCGAANARTSRPTVLTRSSSAERIDGSSSMTKTTARSSTMMRLLADRSGPAHVQQIRHYIKRPPCASRISRLTDKPMHRGSEQSQSAGRRYGVSARLRGELDEDAFDVGLHRLRGNLQLLSGAFVGKSTAHRA